MKYADKILNKITMYRLILYCLVFLLAVALVFSFFGFFPLHRRRFSFRRYFWYVFLARKRNIRRVFEAPAILIRFLSRRLFWR